MTKSTESEKRFHFGWKGTIFILLVITGIGILGYIGLSPIILGEMTGKDLANIGFIVLYVIYIIEIFRVDGSVDFFFWLTSIVLILYTNALFLFYESLFMGGQE